MQDPWFGHRDSQFREIGDRDEWIDWDFALITALQVIEDGTDRNGLLFWETEPERMDVIAIKRIDKFQAAVDRATKGSSKRPYQPSPGEYFVPELDLRGGEWPTYKGWVQNQREELLKEKE